MASFPPSAPWARKSFSENYDSWNAEEILIEDEGGEKAGGGRGVNTASGGHERGQRGGGHHARYFHENRRSQPLGREQRTAALGSTTSTPAYWGGNNFSTVENVTASAGQRAQQCRQARATLFGIVNGMGAGLPLPQRSSQQVSGCVCARRPCVCGSLNEVDINFLPSYKAHSHPRPPTASDSSVIMEEDSVLEIGEICDDNCTPQVMPSNGPDPGGQSQAAEQEEKDSQEEAQGKRQTQYSETSTRQTTPNMLLLPDTNISPPSPAGALSPTDNAIDNADNSTTVPDVQSPTDQPKVTAASETGRKVRGKSKVKKQTANRVMTLKSKRKIAKSKTQRVEETNDIGLFKSDEIQKCGLLLRTGLECGRLRNQIIKSALQFLEMKQQEETLKRSLRSLIKSAVDTRTDPGLLLGMSTSPAFDKAVRLLLESIADTIQTVKPEDDKSIADNNCATTPGGRAPT